MCCDCCEIQVSVIGSSNVIDSEESHLSYLIVHQDLEHFYNYCSSRNYCE